MSYQHSQANKYRHLPSHKNQEGVVIVVALFIVALVATMSYVMMDRLMRDTRQTTMLVRNVQAEFYAQGSIAWAMDRLRHDSVARKPDQLVDAIPIQSPAKSIDGYEIASTIYDLQSRFNVNNVKNKDGQDDFMRLLLLAVPGMTRPQAENILRATIDWISLPSQQNELSKYYLDLPKPYRAAHQPMINASELRLVKGVTPAIYAALAPYIVALPVGTQINLQTAPAIVLASLGPNVTLADATAIVQLRSQKPLSANPASYEIDAIKSGRFPINKTVVISQYFLVETKVTIENQHVLLYTLLSRDGKDGMANVSIIGQSKGTW